MVTQQRVKCLGMVPPYVTEEWDLSKESYCSPSATDYQIKSKGQGFMPLEVSTACGDTNMLLELDTR